MSTVSKIYVEAFLLNGDGTLGMSNGKWFKPQLTVEEMEEFTNSIGLSGEPDCQWCELVVLFARIKNADTGVDEEVPHMRWTSFESFKKEYINKECIPSDRIMDNQTASNYRHMLDYADADM